MFFRGGRDCLFDAGCLRDAAPNALGCERVSQGR
jgi:hypothetical protein